MYLAKSSQFFLSRNKIDFSENTSDLKFIHFYVGYIFLVHPSYRITFLTVTFLQKC